MDSLLTPLERSIQGYLHDTLAKDLVELLAKLALERPADPHLWLAQQLLARSKENRYEIVPKTS